MILDRLMPLPRARVGPLAPDAAATAARIHAESFARPWDLHEIERMLADAAVVGDSVFRGAARQPSGFVLSRIVLDEAEVLTIAVFARDRRRGLARTLLARHLARLAARGVRTLFLEVEEGNAAAIALYRSFGFVQSGRREGYYPKPDGRRAAALTMRLTLG
ncbi:GNAT family N-acetyltransferase [Chelatococcus sp. SYSU_G07232]|uniref:GNAT family N-acetyltransferase n=1 Tax=Chelatococcus albus TaxID=3047466 RepID=A0ABT7AH89_9HYPH|nr:GNAT family N-acetyltransferase [Chelatococcus sp. SYSU_G07232]MDJ1158745.1 GNAT family N-acetyltransferase [Chelatococcus sp. SYSU_G07232]